MTLTDQETHIVDSVLRSRKYHAIYRPTIERIVATLSSRYSPKRLEHEVKRKLHQIWGAYFTRPDFQKLLQKVKSEYIAGVDPKTIVKGLLQLQTSTNERIPIVSDFYQRIFEKIGDSKTVMEYGCGINALSSVWMPDAVTYVGVDVDTELINFLNAIFQTFGLEDRVSVQLGDVLEEKYIPADMTLLLKVLVLFERQVDGVSLRILDKIPSRHLVVSFPTKSITGRERGMKAHYRKLFADLLGGRDWNSQELEFESELVFVVDKGG